jgi:hypothetical protein
LEQTESVDPIWLFCSENLFQNRSMILGYARVSTDAQDLTSQLAQLTAAGCERVFREKISGATADRPQLRKMLASVAHSDVVIIPAVDRLSRDTTDLLVIARDLQKAGAGLRSIAEPLIDPWEGHVSKRQRAASDQHHRRIQQQGKEELRKPAIAGSLG